MLSKSIAAQLAKIEERMKGTLPPGTTQWFMHLLAAPDENEETLTAATLLALNDVLDKPSPDVWEQLQNRLQGDCEEWPESRLLFVAAYNELESHLFDDDESKESLCVLALKYSAAFAQAPQPEDAHERVLRRDALRRHFLVPLLERACPDLRGYSYATHTACLEQASHSERGNLLESIREYGARLRAKV